MSEPVVPPPGEPAPQPYAPSLLGGKVLRKLVEGLAKEPVLLFGFAALLVAAAVGQALGGNLMPTGWILLGVYTLTVIAWLAVRRPRKEPAAPPKPPVSVDQSEDVRIHDSANAQNDSHTGKIEITGSKRVDISGSANTGFPAPPARDR